MRHELNHLSAAGASYNMGANRLQNLGSASSNGDALSYGQSGAILNGLNLNSHSATGVAPATASGQALAFAQNGAQLTTNQPTIATPRSHREVREPRSTKKEEIARPQYSIAYIVILHFLFDRIAIVHF